MKQDQKKMVSAFIREARIAKGYTQKELAELSNISIRSIQRIENGEILPRSYTLKTLSQSLGISFESTLQIAQIQNDDDTPGAATPKNLGAINKPQKIILSIGFPLIVVLVCWTFISQSPRFPETLFELLTLLTIAVGIIVLFLVWLWKTK